MAKKKKKSEAKRPSVPEAQQVPTLREPSEMARPEYEPMSLNDFSNWMNRAYDIQLARAPEIAAMQRAQAGQFAGTANQLLQQYDPRFRQTYKALGARVNQGLRAGYELGPDLGREVTQAVRGAQTARGNILGAAPTAQEAFGTGQAALNLYNQRLGQAQNFLQGRNPMDMMGQVMGQFVNPSQNYVQQGLGVQGMGIAQSGQSAFNEICPRATARSRPHSRTTTRTRFQSTEVNNEGLFNTYDRAGGKLDVRRIDAPWTLLHPKLGRRRHGRWHGRHDEWINGWSRNWTGERYRHCRCWRGCNRSYRRRRSRSSQRSRCGDLLARASMPATALGGVPALLVYGRSGEAAAALPLQRTAPRP